MLRALVILESEKVNYIITSDSKGEWRKGSSKGITYTVKRSVDDETCFSHFAGVEIDGKKLKEKVDYTAVPGSTVIDIKTDALNRLSIGEHRMTVRYDDGEVNADLNIIEEKTDGDDEIPETGDDSNPFL